jgi:dipeptidyl aminopeptidase/acylaminoacyl peptidase
MKTKHPTRLLPVLLLYAAVAAAQTTGLTLRDLIPGGQNSARYTPAGIRQLQWCGDEYIHLQGDTLLATHPAAPSAPRIALTQQQLNETLTSAGHPPADAMPVFTVPDRTKPVVAFTHANSRIHCNLHTRQIVAHYRLDPAGSRWEYDPAGGNLAFTKENNICITTPGSAAVTLAVTHETNPGIVCGTPVHQNEFGIHRGLFWSPDGRALAFYRMDETMVTDYPLVDAGKRVAQARPVKYPMAGMASHQVTVGIYRLADGQTTWLKTGHPKDRYLTNITWSPDSRSLYIAELNRRQDTCRLVRYSAETGERQAELFTETNPRYVEPKHPPLFLPAHPDRFIWQSRRDGYNHLYLYDTRGTQLRQLTSGPWLVKDVSGIDEKGRYLYFTATAPRDRHATAGNPLETYAWQLDLQTGRRRLLSTKPGIHSISLNAAATCMIDCTTSPLIPRDIDLVRLRDARTVKSLLSAANPFDGYHMPGIKVGTLTAADDSTTLYYRLTTPPDMDSTATYPVIIYVYGGPGAQLVTGGWLNGAGGWDLYMAQKGYILFTLDSRGSANRGFEFESIIHRHLGEAETADQMKGVEFLKSLPFVDTARIGVHGWSYGGYMTARLMLTHPGAFRAGVAGGPVTDWQRYEIMYGERYMDHPDENPEGYNRSSLLNKAGNLRGRLLLIHGDEDPVVVWQHSLLLLKACVDAGTFPDCFVYPGHPHNVRGKDRPHLYEKITRYFDDFLNVEL